MFLIVNTGYRKSLLISEITKDTLSECKNSYDCYIFDLEKKTYFNPKENKWKPIENMNETAEKILNG